MTASSQLLHNIQAEQALLGALLLDNKYVEHVSDFLKSIHFATPLHGIIYKAITTYCDRGQIADPITLRPLLNGSQAIEAAGGIGYLADLAGSVFSLSSVSDYGRMIFDLYLRRELLAIGHGVVEEAKAPPTLETTAIMQIEGAEKKLFDLATSGQSGGGAIAFHTALSQAMETAELAYKRDTQVVGVTTGLIDLNRMLGGLHPSDLVILAGRPSMGKTALATNIAFNAAMYHAENPSYGGGVAFFSLEMSAEQLASRIIASESGISSDRIRRGEIQDTEFQTLLKVTRDLGSLQLFIDDSPALTISSVRNRARRLKRQHNIQLVVVDYLQLLEGSGSKGSDNRVQEISEISRGLKSIAKELHVPVLALSQLSRAVEQREDKRPQLSDLRESGSIEQDADVVMFVYRDEYYESRREPAVGSDKHDKWRMLMASIEKKAEVIIAKQRHGPTGTVKLFFDGRLTKFGDLIPLHQEASVRR